METIYIIHYNLCKIKNIFIFTSTCRKLNISGSLKKKLVTVVTLDRNARTIGMVDRGEEKLPLFYVFWPLMWINLLTSQNIKWMVFQATAWRGMQISFTQHSNTSHLLFNTYYVPCTVLNMLHVLTYLFNPPNHSVQPCHPHSRGEETKEQKG